VRPTCGACWASTDAADDLRRPDHLASERAAFAAGLSALQHELPAAAAALSEEKLLDGFRWTNFFLAYQGQDDRALQAAYASLVAQAIDAGASRWRHRIEARPVTGPRLRVGFASAFFHVGTCGRYFRSWITDLDRKRFEVFVYHLYPGMDEIASAIAQRADCFRTSPACARDHPSSRRRSRGRARCSRLPELGMDACSFALAALRLAPRQYAGWGHP
jgi:predicted O-linked N-acetylglucosamine transferase (SPINDLY family)